MITSYASVLELADKPVLETGASCVQVQVLSLAPYRVFITDLSYEHSIFCINRFPQYVGAGFMPALLFYADLVTYSTVTPFRVSAL